MEPINYKIDVQNPFESAAKGYQIGSAISQQQQAQQQAELARQKQLIMQQDLAQLAGNKNATADDYAGIIAKYPQISEHIKRSWDIRSSEQQKSALSNVTKVHAALKSNNPEIAKQLLQEQAEAARNSGKEEEAKAAELMLKTVETSPKMALDSATITLMSVMGLDKYAETSGKLGQEQRAAEQAPADLQKKQADAKTAEVKSKYANSEALLDLEKKGWDIKKISEDIKIAKENNRIAAMNAQTARVGNSLKREELNIKIEEARAKRDEAVRGKVAEVESARSTMDNMLNTVDKLLKNKSLNNVIGSIEGNLPSVFSDEGADAIALIDQIGAQSFMSQVKAIGSMSGLTEKEGDKLQNSFVSMNRVQSEKQFRNAAKEAQRLTLKARKNLAEKYGVPETVADTPEAVPPKDKSTDSMLRELGVL